MVFGYFAHRRDCKIKQQQRSAAISSLPPAYHAPLTASDKEILTSSVSDTACLVRKGELKPIDILCAYGKRALYAHSRTNCLTEILIPSAEEWISSSTDKPEGTGEINLSGALAGVPVSFKDTVNVKGYDSSMGYSKWVNKPFDADSPMVRLLKDAGAVPFVKTNVPITLLSFESTNDVFGRTDNPHVAGYSPGGSTGGEAALLALGGSRIGIGTDVAGSVRLPAHWSGIYTVRCSTGRFLRVGNNTSIAGQEGVPAVYSPMTSNLPDLVYFLKSIINMKPWEYDHTVHPIPWRDAGVELEGRQIRWGVMRDDGVVPPSPACARALEIAVQALKSRGDEIIELTDMPSPYENLRIASLLLNADGGGAFLSHFRSFFEHNDLGVAQMTFYFALPRWIKSIYCSWVRYVKQDPLWAGLLEGWNAKTAGQQWGLVAEREAHRLQWHKYWKTKNIDFLLSVPNALPAVPAGGLKESFASCGYTFMFNLLDYAAGVLPITRVSSDLDALPATMNIKKMNGIARGAYIHYDAQKMHGLPVGVQVVGRRLEEEKVLYGMGRIEEALGEGSWKGIEIEID